MLQSPLLPHTNTQPIFSPQKFTGVAGDPNILSLRGIIRKRPHAPDVLTSLFMNAVMGSKFLTLELFNLLFHYGFAKMTQFIFREDAQNSGVWLYGKIRDEIKN